MVQNDKKHLKIMKYYFQSKHIGMLSALYHGGRGFEPQFMLLLLLIGCVRDKGKCQKLRVLKKIV